MLMRIKELRVASDMTQKDLAVNMGVMQNAVSQWEHEVVLPRTRQLPDLARMFGVSIGDLFNQSDAAAG